MTSEVDSIPYLGNKDGVFRLTEQRTKCRFGGHKLPPLVPSKTPPESKQPASLSYFVRAANTYLRDLEKDERGDESTGSCVFNELPAKISIKEEARRYDLFKDNVSKLCEKASQIHSTYTTFCNQVSVSGLSDSALNSDDLVMAIVSPSNQNHNNHSPSVQHHPKHRTGVRRQKVSANLVLRLEHYRNDEASRRELQQRVTDTVRERHLKSLTVTNFPRINLQKVSTLKADEAARTRKKFKLLLKRRQQVREEKERIEEAHIEHLKKFDPESDYQQYKLALKRKCIWESLVKLSSSTGVLKNVYQNVCLAHKEQRYGRHVRIIQRSWKNYRTAKHMTSAVTEHISVEQDARKSIRIVSKFLHGIRSAYFIRFAICRLMSCAKRIQRWWKRHYSLIRMRLYSISIQFDRAVHAHIDEVGKNLDSVRRSVRDRNRRRQELETELQMLETLLPDGVNRSVFSNICSRICSEKNTQHKMRYEHYLRLLEAWDLHQRNLTSRKRHSKDGKGGKGVKKRSTLGDVISTSAAYPKPVAPSWPLLITSKEVSGWISVLYDRLRPLVSCSDSAFSD